MGAIKVFDGRRFGQVPITMVKAPTISASSATLFALFGYSCASFAQDTLPDRLNCTVKPLRVIEVASPTVGVVQDVAVKSGDRVQKGDLLIALDNRVLKAERTLAETRANNVSSLESAKLRAEGLEKRVARLKRGFESNAVSEADFEAASLELALAKTQIGIEEDRLREAQAELSRIDAQLSLLRVESPDDGVVGEGLINPGESVSDGPVAVIYVNQPLRLEAFVPSAHLSAFMDKSEHRAFIDGANQGYALDLDYRSVVTDISSNTVSVFFKMDAPDVLPGSQCGIG